MDKSQLDDMNNQLERLYKGYQKRVKEYSKKSGMPERWVRPIVKAQVAIENLQARVARKMGVTPQEASSHAKVVAGDSKLDMANIEEYGASQWAFARCHLTLSKIDDLAHNIDGSPFPAVAALAQVADTLVFAMEVLGKEQRASNGAKGGKRSAEVTAAVRDEAIRLANEMVPEGGWASAPKAAAEIFPHLAMFAKVKGRNPSMRKIEEWLRGAGIKKSHTH